MNKFIKFGDKIINLSKICMLYNYVVFFDDGGNTILNNDDYNKLVDICLDL